MDAAFKIVWVKCMLRLLHFGVIETLERPSLLLPFMYTYSQVAKTANGVRLFGRSRTILSASKQLFQIALKWSKGLYTKNNVII